MMKFIVCMSTMIPFAAGVAAQSDSGCESFAAGVAAQSDIGAEDLSDIASEPFAEDPVLLFESDERDAIVDTDSVDQMRDAFRQQLAELAAYRSKLSKARRDRNVWRKTCDRLQSSATRLKKTRGAMDS